MFGKIEIIASQDIGQLGPSQSQPVTHNCSVVDSVTGLALWVVLLLVLVLIKANRNPRAWLILIPLGIVFTLWSMIKNVLPLPSEAMAVFDQQLAATAIGFSVLLLLGHKIGNRNRFATFMLGLLFMILVAIVGGISFGGFSPELIVYAIFSFAMAVLMLLAFVFAGLCCRKKFSYPKFTIWLGVWTTSICEAIFMVYYLIAVVAMTIIGESFPMSKLQLLLLFLLYGLAIGGILFAILLPFMILVAKSGFFRDRLFACMRLKSMEATNSLNGFVDVEELSAEADSDIQLPDQEDSD